ncbi:MAG: hypothetical protein IT167_16865 [Bryobacterales bacterium]|nr:hypothetical protein [Bryobacterales bacterium]
MQPVYPVALDDGKMGIQTDPFLSEEFLAHLKLNLRYGVRFEPQDIKVKVLPSGLLGPVRLIDVREAP